MQDSFAFGKRNYQILLAGLAVIILGYILMSGGGSADPSVFSYEIFSPRRITVAPVVVLTGYGLVFYAIMHKPAPPEEPAVSPAPRKKKS
ncbi:MAG: DUF3098 domain-containing protein [Flavobacteriales bacterium]|jgi:hypothetical protein